MTEYLVKLSLEQVEDIERLLREHGYQEYAELLKNEKLRYRQGLGKFTDMQLCDHEWSTPDKRDAQFFHMDSMEEHTAEEKMEIWRHMFSYCKKCGLQYKHAGTDMDKAQQTYEKNFYFAPAFSSYYYYKSVEEQYDKEMKEKKRSAT